MFGYIDNGEMVLNDCGIIANEWIGKLSGRFTNAIVDSYVIMPNHVHLILRIVAKTVDPVASVSTAVFNVGAIHELPLRMRPELPRQIRQIQPELPPQQQLPLRVDNESYRKNRRVMAIPKIIGYYRMNTGKHINAIRKTSGNPVWQRNYWEHIIRDEQELFRIRQYIKNNPANWTKDKFKNGFENTVHEDVVGYETEEWMI